MNTTTVTLVVGFLAERYALTSRETLILSKLADFALKKDSVKLFKENSTGVAVASSIAGLGYAGYKWISSRKPQVAVQTIPLEPRTFKVYDHSVIQTICGLFALYPEVLENGLVDIGTKYDLGVTSNSDTIAKVKLFLPSVPTNFVLNHNARHDRQPITGKVHLTFEDTAVEKESGSEIRKRNFKAPAIIVTLDGDLSSLDFVNAVDDYVAWRKMLSRANLVKTFMYTIHRYESSGLPNWLQEPLLDTTLDKYNPREHVDGHFYEHKAKFFKMLDDSLARGKQFTCLLHGPGGTGKSSMAAVVANYLKRNLVIMDIRHVSKSTLLTTLINGLKNTSTTTTHFTSSHTESVIVLDEFDDGLKALVHQRDQEKEVKLADGTTMKATSNDTANKFKLEDLKNLLQGPVQRSGLVIIATTNNLEYIEKVDKEIIRFGRMTPWYFGYVSQHIYEEIVEYYFGKDSAGYVSIPQDHNIPTAEIIKYAEMSGDVAEFSGYMADRITTLDSQRPKTPEASSSGGSGGGSGVTVEDIKTSNGFIVGKGALVGSTSISAVESV